MANTDRPMGFEPVGHFYGGEIRTRNFVVTASQTIFKGDPVVITNAGTINVGAASATTTHLGIAAEYIASASAGDEIAVWCDPGIIYKVQTTDAITTTVSNVFNTADIITYAAGNTTTGQSIMELNTPGTSSKPWLILGLSGEADNAWGEFSKVEVIYNQHVAIGAYAGL